MISCGAAILLFCAGADSAGAFRSAYPDLSRFLHQQAVGQMPKVIEDSSKWGRTIPAPPPEKKMAFRKLRKRYEDDDGIRMPHGTWKRSKVWIDDPQRDFLVSVHQIEKLDNGKTLIRIGATISSHGEIEQQNWSKGLRLLAVKVVADSTVDVILDCEIGAELRAASFFPQIAIEPQVVDCQIELTRFKLKRIGPIGGEVADQLGRELEDLLRQLIRRFEPKVIEKANEAIAKSIDAGKNTISLATFTRMLGGPSKSSGNDVKDVAKVPPAPASKPAVPPPPKPGRFPPP